MKKTKDFFPLAYQTDNQVQVNRLYDQWAASYDEELERNGYVTPQRCAVALKKFVSIDQPVLDYGCGTGLSGRALMDAGYLNIKGTDINKKMLRIAKKKRIYKDLLSDKELKSFLRKGRNFPNIIAVGVISSGAGPASLLIKVLSMLDEGGLLCFSYNDHTLSDQSYLNTLEFIKKRGLVEQLFSGYGDHLLQSKVGSMVYVLRKVIKR